LCTIRLESSTTIIKTVYLNNVKPLTFIFLLLLSGVVSARDHEDDSVAAERAFGSVKSAIQEKVIRNWAVPQDFTGMTVELRVNVDRQGEVISVVVTNSSGNHIHDQSVENAIYKASPLPFPPQPRFYEYLKEFNFIFKLPFETRPKVRPPQSSPPEDPVKPSTPESESPDRGNTGGTQKEFLALGLVVTFLLIIAFWVWKAVGPQKQHKRRAEVSVREQEEAQRAAREEESRRKAEHERTQRIAAAEEQRRKTEKQEAQLGEWEDIILRAHHELNIYEYFSGHQMETWVNNHKPLNKLNNLMSEIVEVSPLFEQISEIKKVLENPPGWREKKNKKFLKTEKRKFKKFFDNIEEHPLTEKQRDAILSNDNRCLTVAGAGTGKTSTVVGKVGYLLKTQWCRPSEILLLSFSRETVRELEERVETIGGGSVVIKTFHALGLKIIADSGEPVQEVLERAPVEKYLRELLHDDHKYKHLIEYLVFYFYPNKYENDFETTEEYKQFATSQDLRTLRAAPVPDEPLMTLRRERVKSFQEVQIANWLYTHGIQYQYEMQYPDYTKRYRPDFYLTNYGIYIEHFGINRDGSTRKDIDQEQYRDSMIWKRSLHDRNGTTLVETYSYQFREGDVFQILEQSLVSHGVVFEPMGIEELRGVQAIYDDLKVLAKLTATFLNLFKSDQVTLPELMERYPLEDYKRENLFLQLFSEVLELYEADLASTGTIDFGDMIVKATGYVESNEFKNPYKAIIVDEYQDISRARARLIDSLQKQSPDLRLLCVGDDWQSIYRFTGSDLSLMTEFEKQWDAVIRIDLDRTYRFNDRILEVSSKFITKNPIQLQKTIKANVSVDKPVIHISGKTVQDAINQIGNVTNDEDTESTVLVLGRYNFTDGVRFNYVSPRIQGMTVHRSKGLEADYVIVNDMGSGKYGFPSQLREDPIVSMLLTEGEGFPNGEERRLFYVAITRAKKEVWLLESKKQPPSEFLIELSTDGTYRGLVESKQSEINTDIRCPECGSLMQKRRGRTGDRIFFGCIHYPRCDGTLPGCPRCNESALLRYEDKTLCNNSECGHVPTACPACETGILIRRTGDEFDFIGCSSHPDCRYTEQIN